MTIYHSKLGKTVDILYFSKEEKELEEYFFDFDGTEKILREIKPKINLYFKQFKPRILRPHWGNDDLLEMFPECISIIKEMIKERKDKLSNIYMVRKHLWNKFPPATQLEKLPFNGTDIFASDIEKDIDRLKKILPIKGKKKIKGFYDVEKAKQRLITDFLKVDRGGKTKCIWHNEKTGSLHYYRKDNRVKCFGCGKSGDVIDVVQELMKVGFTEAVRIINN